jgi:hypothetical protein
MQAKTGSAYMMDNYLSVLALLAKQNEKAIAAGQPAPYTPNENNQYVSQSFLCSAFKLSPNISTYAAALGVNGLSTNTPTKLAEENRLTLQDLFFAFEIGYFFNIKATNGGSTIYQSQYFTHPPGQIYSGSNINTLNALWDAKGRFQANNQPVTPYWDMRGHYETPMTQYPVFTGPLLASTTIPVNDEQYGVSSGFRQILPGWVMDGGSTNEFLVNYNSSLANIGIAGDMYMIIYLRGIMAQNCGKIMTSGIYNPVPVKK